MPPRSISAFPLLFARTMALLAVLAGLIVSVVAARPSAPNYFLGNLAYYWLPQVAVLGILLLLRSPPALLGGVALALALHLAVFDLWLITDSIDVMGWLFYFFDFPGALVGALIAQFSVFRRDLSHPAWVALLGFGWTTLGLVVSLAPLWRHWI